MEDLSMSKHSNADYAALVLRVSMGVMFFAYGFLMKTLGYGPAAFAQYIASVGYPAFLGYIIILVEVFGGLMLVLGFWSRWVALAALPILLGATLEHLPNGWIFSNPHGGWSYPAFWAAALVVQMLLGDGAYALRSILQASPAASRFARA
jgi:putative oxidoreductase